MRLPAGGLEQLPGAGSARPLQPPLSFNYEKTDTGMVPTSDIEGRKSI
jgi:hypothetical protein